MFFVLSKVVYFFLQPFVWLIVALVWFLIVKNKVRKKRLKFTVLFILFFFSNTAILKTALHLWEVPSKKISQIKEYDLAVVLGGMFEWDNDVQRLSARRGSDRIWQAIQLYEAKKVDKILIAGASGYVFDRGLDEAQQLKSDLMKMGIPEKDLLIETHSRNTHENAQYVEALIRQSYPHIEKVLLVTSARHMRRAQACFQKEGLICTTFSTDQYTGSELSFNWDEFIFPNADTMNEWTELIKEVVGYIVYDVTGFI